MVSLGGARYPHAPALRHDSFAPSSKRIAAKLAGEGLGIVDADDHFDLFDIDASWPDQLIDIRNWVRAKTNTGDAVDAIIVHYVGHGFFRRNSEHYYLSINRTDAEVRDETSATLAGLAGVIRKHASCARAFYIVDACFAASVIKDLQADGAGDAIRAKVSVAFDASEAKEQSTGGLAALCSSSPIESSSAAGRDGVTQFTDGLITILDKGDPAFPAALSLQRVATLLRGALKAHYGDEAIAPVLHAPQGTNGGIGGFPLFPNRCISDDTLYALIDESRRTELRERANSFVDDLTTLESEQEADRRIDAIRMMGNKEVREAEASSRFLRPSYTGAAAFTAALAPLEESVPARGDGWRLRSTIARNFPRMEFTRVRKRNPAKCIVEGMKHLASLKDHLLIDNAHWDAERNRIRMARDRLMQMAFIATEMKTALAGLVSKLEHSAQGAVRARTALDLCQERLSEILDVKARVDREEAACKSAREENFARIKFVDRSMTELRDLAKLVDAQIAEPIDRLIDRKVISTRLAAIADELHRALVIFGQVRQIMAGAG